MKINIKKELILNKVDLQKKTSKKTVKQLAFKTIEKKQVKSMQIKLNFKQIL